MSYREKLDKIGPRKLLACNGGGIPRIISIEVLVELSAMAKAEYFPGWPVAS